MDPVLSLLLSYEDADDIEFDESIAVIYTILTTMTETRNFWVHPMLENMQRYGSFWTLLAELDDHEDKFKQYLRLSREQFYEVLDKISPEISKEDTQLRDAIPAAERLAVCLR